MMKGCTRRATPFGSFGLRASDGWGGPIVDGHETGESTNRLPVHDIISCPVMSVMNLSGHNVFGSRGKGQEEVVS